jgi:ACR3 family arsenite transporter
MILGSSHVYRQIIFSLFLNWIVGPFARPDDADSHVPRLTRPPPSRSSCSPWHGRHCLICRRTGRALSLSALPDASPWSVPSQVAFLAARADPCDLSKVMIWTQLAHGDIDYCAILVIINSVLQIILFAPMSVFFVNVISGETAETGGVRLEYGKTAIAVLIVRDLLVRTLKRL